MLGPGRNFKVLMDVVGLDRWYPIPFSRSYSFISLLNC